MVKWKKLNRKWQIVGVMVPFFRIHNSLCICDSVGRDGKYRSGTDGDGTE